MKCTWPEGAVASFSEAVHGYAFWQFDFYLDGMILPNVGFLPHHLLEIKQLVIATLLENELISSYCGPNHTFKPSEIPRALHLAKLSLLAPSAKRGKQNSFCFLDTSLISLFPQSHESKWVQK